MSSNLQSIHFLFTKITKFVVYPKEEKKALKLNQLNSWRKNEIFSYYSYLGHVAHHIEAPDKHSVYSKKIPQKRWSTVRKKTLKSQSRNDKNLDGGMKF